MRTVHFHPSPANVQRKVKRAEVHPKQMCTNINKNREGGRQAAVGNTIYAKQIQERHKLASAGKVQRSSRPAVSVIDKSQRVINPEGQICSIARRRAI